MQTNHPESSVNAGGDGPKAIVNFVGKSISAVAVCAALCGVAGALSLVAWHQANVAERETRMLQYYVNEVDGKLIHAGFIEQRERWSPAKRAEMAKKLEESNQ
jgi:hypothetical protein